MTTKEPAVIYNTEEGVIIKRFPTLRGARIAYTRMVKQKLEGKEFPPMNVMTLAEWREKINRKYIGSRGYEVDLETPRCCDPNSELYWTM